MTINDTKLQVYRPEQLRPVTPSKPQTAPELNNQLLRAQFAQLLSDTEKKFITQNFKPDTSDGKDSPKLGRLIDVRA